MHRIDSVRIRGFRSLADVALENVPDTTVLIGAIRTECPRFHRWLTRLESLRD